MNVLFSLKGKGVATMEGATQVPREGDWVWLNISGTDEIFRVRRVTFEAVLVEGSENKEGLERVHKERDVYVLIEPLEADNK